MNYIIFTDLDGTLLDKDTYSFETAKHALKLVKDRKIPLIVCTSKTRAEIEFYRKKLENNEPFISENGGAIFIPKNYFDYNFDYNKKSKDYFIIEFGTPYKKLRTVLKKIKKQVKCKITGFGDMDAETIVKKAGLSLHEAKLSKKREYDESFEIIGNKKEERAVIKAIKKLGFNCTKGGRFWHLIGKNDKGKAVEKLTELYKTRNKEIKTVGLGDSLNDLPMLKAVNYAFLIQKPDGSYDKKVFSFVNVKKVKGVGPIGWSKAISDLLERK